MTKRCIKCKQSLPKNQFSKDKSRKDGLHYRCKECDKKHYKETSKKKIAYVKVYYKENLEEKKAYRKNYNNKNPERYIWHDMIRRCTNTKSAGYKYYGGRGIKVCDRWLNSFDDFLKDMGKRPSPELTIDRIDNNDNYEPSNCKWSTMAEQNNNRRNNKKNK